MTKKDSSYFKLIFPEGSVVMDVIFAVLLELERSTNTFRVDKPSKFPNRRCSSLCLFSLFHLPPQHR